MLGPSKASPISVKAMLFKQALRPGLPQPASNPTSQPPSPAHEMEGGNRDHNCPSATPKSLRMPTFFTIQR